MSHHLNTMLEHLRMGPRKKTKTSNVVTNECDGTSTTGSNDNRKDGDKDKINVCCSDINGQIIMLNTCDSIDDNQKLNQQTNRSIESQTVTNHIDPLNGLQFDPRKRYSVPAATIQYLHHSSAAGPNCGATTGGQVANGTVRKSSRELSPIPRNMQRKLSADMRFRGGSNSHLDDDGHESLRYLRRPVKLRSMATKAETYDTLHTKAYDVSLSFLVLHFF